MELQAPAATYDGCRQSAIPWKTSTLAYATIGGNDLPRVAGFHDEVLGIIGGKRSMEFGQFIAWGTGEDAASLAVTKRFDGNAATVGNGCTVSLQADSRETVERVPRRHSRGRQR